MGEGSRRGRRCEELRVEGAEQRRLVISDLLSLSFFLACWVLTVLDIALALYLHALNQVRDFRWRHWCFTREYILKKTKHPTATGGSPVVLWLPNQLFSVYDLMEEVDKLHGGFAPNCTIS